jgi:hypothetical protein
MSLPLQIVLCLAITTLTVFLVLLILQARRTAAAVERLADSAARDLRQVAEDVHEVRGRIDEVSDLVHDALELPSVLTQVVSGVIRAVPSLFKRRKSSTNWIEPLLTGIETALHLFRRPMANPPKETTHE